MGNQGPSQAELRKQRQSIIAQIEARRARYGGGSAGRMVHFGDDEPSVERIPTGSPWLDYATCGGIPIGRWTRFYGGKSSGKSLTCWNTIREAQALGMSCAYANIEKQYDKDFTAACGVDVKNLLLIEGNVIEEVGEAVKDLLPVVDLFVLDSCSEGIANEEAVGEFEDKQFSPSVRAWNKVFKKVQVDFDETRHTIVYLDHIRDKFGGQGGVQPPGGRMMEHRSSMTLYFRAGAWLFRNKKGRLVTQAEAGLTMSGGVEGDGIEVTVRVEKSRVGRPFRVAKMRYDIDGARLDTCWELAVAAQFLDANGMASVRSGKPPMVEKNGSWFKLPDGKHAQGENGLAAALEQRPELREIVLEAMRKGWRPIDAQAQTLQDSGQGAA